MASLTKPLIVLIPGGFHKPSHYASVTRPLREEHGYDVLCLPLTVCGDDPSTVSADATADDDAAAVLAELIPQLDSGMEAVVVAHSYGSMVATRCIRDQTKTERAAKGLKGGIVAAVWIAGFSFPARGKNIMGGDEVSPHMPYQTLKVGGLEESRRPLNEQSHPSQIYRTLAYQPLGSRMGSSPSPRTPNPSSTAT